MRGTGGGNGCIFKYLRGVSWVRLEFCHEAQRVLKRSFVPWTYWKFPRSGGIGRGEKEEEKRGLVNENSRERRIITGLAFASKLEKKRRYRKRKVSTLQVNLKYVFFKKGAFAPKHLDEENSQEGKY